MIGTTVGALRRIEERLALMDGRLEFLTSRLNRPYYTLSEGWGLTFLDTGQYFFVDTSDRAITPWIIMGGHWEPNVTRPLLTYAQPGMNVVDIGAHMGYYTVKLGAKIGPTGRLFAFEPNPLIFPFCIENVKINNLSGHTMVFDCALGNTKTTETLSYSGNNSVNANLLFEQSADVSFKVQVNKLDDIIEPHTKIDLIKLDAEGFERFILEGSQNAIKRSPHCALMIELGLERWERGGAIDDLTALCGRTKTIYKVCPDGCLEEIDVKKIKDFLLTCLFHENYFFIGEKDKIRTFAGELLRS
ncbi:hypothetical protein BN1110_02397 [bacterium YEK0313]|nr:hypothetical protein BN1110_02397 [bacterium YEK0313]